MPGPNPSRDEPAARSRLLRVQSCEMGLDVTRGPAVLRSTTRICFSAKPGASTFVDLVAQRVRTVKLDDPSVGLLDRTDDWLDTHRRAAPGLRRMALARRDAARRATTVQAADRG